MAAARRLLLLLGTPIIAAIGIAVIVHAGRHPDQSLGGAGSGALTLELAAGLGACAAGADLALRRSLRLSGALLAASGVALLLGAVLLPEAGGAALFTAALALGGFAPALAGAAALCHPVIDRRLGALIAGTIMSTIAVFGVLPTATFDPVASGCSTCPRNLLLVRDQPGLRDAVISAAPWVLALLCALLALAAAARWARRPALLRRAAAPVALGGALAAALGSAAFARAAATGAPRVDDTARTLWLAQCAALALAAAGVAVQALRARALRGQMADIVAATLPAPQRLRDALARSLDDPGLAIAYPGVRDGPIDADGRRASDPAPGTATTEVTRGGQVVALLYHDAALAHAPERLAAAARGAGPALEHASLRARLQAELAELSASRTRVVELADAERRQAERDLHDGAQQRLIALSLALEPEADASLARAHQEIRAALRELRELAHGIYPVALTDAGLEAAVRELADGSGVPVRLDAITNLRFATPIELAAYRLVLDAVRGAERGGDGRVVSVQIEQAAGALHVAIALPRLDAAAVTLHLEHAADRIAALDGELAVRTEPDATRLEASIPCES